MRKYRNIFEAPIDYGDSPERMDPSLQQRIEKGEFPGKDLPAYPSVDPSGVEDKFEELVASKRFRQVVDQVKRYTGLREVTPRTYGQLQSLLMQSFQKVNQIEKQNKEELEQLAVDIVKEEMALPDNAFQFDAKLVNMGQVDTSKMKGGLDEPTQQNLDAEEEAMEEFENFDLERQKRRFLNQLIQGASKKGHYMFHLVEDELNQINPDLLNLYGVMMSINDLIYWIMPDQTTTMMAASGQNVGGSEEIDVETDPPTIKARGISFPVLVHELIKGVMEVLGTQGLPDDEKQARKVMDSEDTLVAEVWDLRLGPIIWEKFRSMYPLDLMQDDKSEIQNYLFAEFASMPAEDMFKLAKEILSGTQKGKDQLTGIVEDIIQRLQTEDYEDEVENYTDDYDDEDYGDVLGSLDIVRDDEEMDMDIILDKISKSGLSSLSDEELDFLRSQS